jgi:hypothetical protein
MPLPNFQIPPDNRFCIVPLGEHVCAGPDDGEITWVVDQAALDSIRQQFESGQGRYSPSNGGILLDYDSGSADLTKPTVAAGWCTDLLPGENGLDGIIRFTPDGRARLEGEDYRFIEPSFDLESAIDLGGGRLRPTQIDFLSLTNKPEVGSGRPTSTVKNRAGATAATAKRREKTIADMITNRAKEILADVPGTAPLGAYIAAQKEIEAEMEAKPGDRAAFIANRARKLRAANPGMSTFQSYSEVMKRK